MNDGLTIPNVLADRTKFHFICEINPNPTAYIIPFNYKNSENELGEPDDAPNEAVTISGYPTISYITDFYNAWLAQNSGVLEVQMRQEQYNYEVNTSIAQMKNISGAVQNSIGAIGNSITTANPTNAITGGIQVGSDLVINDMLIQQQHQNHGEYVNMMMAQKEKQAMLPNSANLGSSNSTLLGYEYFNKCTFICYRIKREFAEKIDKYFDMYGYSTNKIKIPNLNTRSNWNYLKTVGINILAEIPELDLQRIKDMFNNGITLWHNPATFLDYSQNNN